MSDHLGHDEASDHAQTLIVISKFCRAAAALINPITMPSLHLTMLMVLAEVDDELRRAGVTAH